MKEPRDYRDYLADMIEASDKVASFIHGMALDGFLAYERTQYALGWQVPSGKWPSSHRPVLTLEGEAL